jgi:hypothetical protein
MKGKSHMIPPSIFRELDNTKVEFSEVGRMLVSKKDDHVLATDDQTLL